MTDLLTPKQAQFIKEAECKWNLAHGAVRSGKTVGTIFKFLVKAAVCPDSQIYIVGHSFDTAYRNVVRLIMEDPAFALFKPFCSWSGKKLYYRDKIITVLGAKDEGAIGNFQGNTHSLTYCDEITLYPESIIDMIDTRLSCPWSQAYATMNPTYPTHKVKQWIDAARTGDKNYYEMHFKLEDNTFLGKEYVERIRNSLSGVFYRRNYLGEWCLAEGAIFDFFDRNVYVLRKPPAAAEYFIAAIDYGASNPFACIVVGVSTGQYTQMGKKLWVEDEYYWDPKKTHRQKTNDEFCKDVVQFLEPYFVKQLYIDPSAAAFKTDLRKAGLTPIDANNEVLDGIQIMTSEMQKGNLFVLDKCKNLIREIETYVWDKKASEKGDDEPMKRDDHACVTRGTLIALGIGCWCPIEKLTGTLFGLVYGANDNDQIELGGMERGELTRENAEIWEIELEDGKKLKATPDHKVLTKRGYIELQQLTLSDMIGVTDMELAPWDINSISEKNSI